MPTRHLPAPQPGRGTRALAPRREALPSRALAGLPARVLPVARGSIVAAGAALATEYALRRALGGKLDRMLTPVRQVTPSSTVRTEITEWMIVERLRRA